MLHIATYRNYLFIFLLNFIYSFNFLFLFIQDLVIQSDVSGKKCIVKIAMSAFVGGPNDA